MLIYGASGHSKVIISCLEANGVEICGVFDDNPNLKEIMGYKVEGAYCKDFASEDELIIGIGNNLIRKRITKLVKHCFGTVINPSAVIDKSALIGKGTVVFQNSCIQVDVKIGKHCIINTSASIDHDCNIANFVHISPNSTLCGGVNVGEGSWIGAGSTIIQGVKVGRNVVIGAGTVVLSDVPDNAVVVGNPGSIIKYNNEQK